jgi:hypothetical protein
MRPRTADHHTALRSEVLAKVSARGVDITLARLQNAKDDVSYSLHAEPTSFSLSGLDPIDLLATIGFTKERCSFVARQECLAAWVPEAFPLQAFAEALPDAFSNLEIAERRLQQFGLLIPGRSPSERAGWDGHTSPSPSELKRVDDDSFHFVLSWVEGPRQKGWIYHYRPKHPPLSPEVEAAFGFLELPSFTDCPYFEFEGCHWQYFPFRSDEHSITGGNAQVVHDAFAKLPVDFSLGVEAIVKCHARLEPYGFPLLTIPQQAPQPLPQRAAQASAPNSKKAAPRAHEYDVAISFAGAQRPLAESLAVSVRDAGFLPFFDSFFPEHLWGKDLAAYFDDIYRKKSRYCVMFISREYAESMWTIHERKSAQARALEERGNEYILPIRVDDTELPGLQPTIDYLSIRDYPIERIASILTSKLRGA